VTVRVGVELCFAVENVSYFDGYGTKLATSARYAQAIVSKEIFGKAI